MKKSARAAAEAAAEATPCATFERTVNDGGVAVCTMKVDRVESLRTGDD